MEFAFTNVSGAPQAVVADMVEGVGLNCFFTTEVQSRPRWPWIRDNGRCENKVNLENCSRAEARTSSASAARGQDTSYTPCS